MTNQTDQREHGSENQIDGQNKQADINNEAEFLVGEQKLSSVTDDAFGHEAYVDTLEKVVARVSCPWHIALYGTWGAGKSSIVNLLYRRIRAQQTDGNQYPDVKGVEVDNSPTIENTLCISFDAWKHAEDSLRTELLLDLNQSLQAELDNRFGDPASETDTSTETTATSDGRLTLHGRDQGVLSSERLINELYDVEEVDDADINSVAESISEVDNLVLGGVILVVIFGFVLLAVDLLGNPLPLNSGTLAVINGLAAAFVVLGGGRALASSFADEIREARRDVDRKLANPQNEWSGAYENLFDAIIAESSKQYAERHPDDDADLERIVVTIDDIDRCQSQTALNILIALKSFLSHDMCVYIIPCDEDALYQHLEAADEGQYLSDAVNQQNFLAKFFETELEIPTPSERRLGEYFQERMNQFDRSFDPRSLEVLQEADLDTPRRVTRSLNRLVVLEELAENRGVLQRPTSESTGSSGETDVTNAEDASDSASPIEDPAEWDPQRAFLTVISILQADYARLHAALERDPELLDELYEQLAGGFAVGERQGLDPLLESFNIPEERRDSLVRFLSQTRDIAERIDSPDPYLRLTGSPPNPADRFKARFDRGRSEAAHELVDIQEGLAISAESDASNNAEEALEEIIEHIIQKLGEEAAQVEAFSTAVAVVPALAAERRERVAEAILGALEEEGPQKLLSEMALSEFEPLFESLPSDRTQEFLKLYVQSVVGNDGLRPENFRSVVEGPGELLEAPDVQSAFTDTIHTARRRGHISDAKFGAMLSDVREQKPELYTPELVQVK